MENLKPLFHTIPSKQNNLLQACLMFLCLFHNIFQSSGADTLYANQSLSGDQTLISSGGIFELGFFKPGTSSPYYYVGIWYKKITPQTVVWVANRNRPVSDKYSAVLKVVEDGNLVLLDESKVQIWSTNVNSTFSNSVHVVLLDNGNLMLKDDPKLEMNSVIPIWQSFDYPTHTFLPGSKISYNKRTKAQQIITSWKNSEDPATGSFSIELDANENQFLVKWNRSELYWSSGPWDGEAFSSLPEMKLHYLFNYSYVSNENESYFMYSLISPSMISRLVLDVSGQVQQLTWLENTKQWTEFWARPQKICQIYGVCGPFGSCNDSSLFCSCPNGFVPSSESDWNLGDFSGGCTRETNLDCQNLSTETRNNVGFLKRGWNLRNFSSDQPSRTQYLPINVANEAECKSTCLNDCSCNVYTYLSDVDVCYIWKDEILNLLQQSEDDDVGARKVYLKVASSDLPRGLVSKSSNGKLAAGIISGIVILVVLSSFSTGYIFYKKRTRRGQGRGEEEQESSVLQLYEPAQGAPNAVDPRQLRRNDTKGIEVPFFEFETVVAATDNFSEANRLGQGGFGPVYKGKLPEGIEIAVKRLSSHSGQGVQEFKNEVSLIAKLQHRNLVRLLGYSLKGDEMILLYEYMLNKSLGHFIFG